MLSVVEFAHNQALVLEHTLVDQVDAITEATGIDPQQCATYCDVLASAMKTNRVLTAIYPIEKQILLAAIGLPSQLWYAPRIIANVRKKIEQIRVLAVAQ